MIKIKKINLLRLAASSIAMATFSFAFALTTAASKENKHNNIIETSLSIENIQADLPHQEYQFLSFNDNEINTENNFLTLTDKTSNSLPEREMVTDDAFNSAILFDKIATEDKVDIDVEAVDIAPAARTVTFNARVYSDEEISLYALTPFKIAQDTDIIKYRYNNMYDDYCAEINTSQITDNDLYWMAKIIHAEICLLGDEARRSVGTVIVNRIADPKFPNNVYDVIHQSGQFSTAHTSKEPCEACYAAAYDVLYNNYRSFPWYVNSFQSICDNYFAGHNTYVEFNDGTYRTWFSYNRNSIG